MYATRQDMETIFGTSELIKLTDRARTGQINDEVLTKALRRASSMIDSYIGSRYPLPLSPSIIPEDLTDRCCAIARYKLCSGPNVQMTELIRVEYEDAVRWLEKVAGGIIKLGSGESGTPKTTSNAVRFQSGGRQFGRDKTNWGAF